jgi:hypothetical protein
MTAAASTRTLRHPTKINRVSRQEVDNMSKINPFGKTTVERSCMDILTENFGIGIKEYDRGADVWDDAQGKWVWQSNVTNECVIEFSVNEGKGTGRQVIPVSEFKAYVDTLQGIIDSGYREPEGGDRTTYIPTNVIAAQSFKMITPRDEKGGERNVVSVRCTGGKGAKPMMVPRDQFAEVVQTLSGIVENISEYEKKAWENFYGSGE